MAAIDVHLFLEKLKQLMSSGLDFVASQRDELEIVHGYIKEMSMLLKLTEKERSTDMAMHIRDLIFEAESIVDLFIVDPVSSGGGGYCDLSTKLDSVKGEMESIIKNFKDGKFQFELEWWYTKAADSTNSHVVGLGPHIDKIMSRFKHRSLEIISIVGLPGTGKTTLVKQIYDDDCTRENFEIQAWIKVGQGYRKRDVLASILESFNHIFKDEGNSDEECLGGLLLMHLHGRKFLIVLDDMSTAQALFDLQKYLPNQPNGNKIIVTTREAMVAKDIKKQDYYYSYAIRLDALSEDDSWELFQMKLLEYQATVSNELKEFGKLIVKQCHGLPLAIDVISRVLARKSKTPSLWGSTGNTLAILQQSYMDYLICSYDQLTPRLKSCLLYIGLFPEDYPIPVRELAWLWIAEGFITEQAVVSPEVVAQGYISDLVDGCLVTVLTKNICGATKTCCISRLMRQFCCAKAEESIFGFQACFLSATQNDVRRLFISGEAYSSSMTNQNMQSLRSLLCFGDGDGRRYQDHIGRIFCGSDIKLLKVLDLLCIQLNHPFEIGVMVHLTYLAFQSVYFPESIANLFNMETLILSKRGVIYLPPGILKLDKLRRVCNKAGVLCLSRSDVARNSGIAGDLQTVYPLCGCRICSLMLDRRELQKKFPRIRKLGISQHEPDVFSPVPYELSLLEDLETLKCSYPFNYAYRKRERGTYPFLYRFNLNLPSSIKRLSLRSTFLEWEMISVLGTLPNLEVLKLLDNAFAMKEEGVGSSSWDITGQEFPRLKCLKMRHLDITEWVGNYVEFNSLEVLSMVGCDQLRMLPSGLVRAPLLRTVEVNFSCNGYVDSFIAKLSKAEILNRG